jgi:deferrochelatase/peroxidase EfeB
VAGLLAVLTTRARFLTTGGSPPAAAPSAGNGRAEIPPSDSDVLGPVVPPDGLTVTVAVGASLFDDRFGLADRRPRHLTAMPAFPDDQPDPAWLHGDVLVQVCADHPDTVHHALRDIARQTRGTMVPRWKLDGYASPPRPSGTPRNLMGFKDGTANPTGMQAAGLVWVDDPAEPAWAQGGCYQVVRLIRMRVEEWDRVAVPHQERVFGRQRDSGAPLGRSHEFDEPDYAGDPRGERVPLTAHMRLANPRTAATADQRFLRRSYNYDLGLAGDGTLQVGHVFTAFQQDVERQFATVQRRLAHEPMTQYVEPFGGGYFFVLPGVTGPTDVYGRSLLA